MEFTWLKTCAAKKYTFFRAHFLVSGHGIFKMHLYPVVFLVFWRCVFLNLYWSICDAILIKKCIYYLPVWHLSRPGVSFTPWAPVSCAGVFIFHVCGNRICIFYCICICLLVHAELDVSFLESASLDCTCGKKKITFLLQVYLGGIFFSQGQAYLWLFLRQLESLPGLEISTIWLYVRQIRNN